MMVKIAIVLKSLLLNKPYFFIFYIQISDKNSSTTHIDMYECQLLLVLSV